MRRFFVSLYALPVLLHAPMGIALGYMAALAGVPLPWALGLGAATALALAFRGRVALQRWDRPVGRWRTILEEAYFVHWMAIVLAMLLWLPAIAVHLAVWPSELAS